MGIEGSDVHRACAGVQRVAPPVEVARPGGGVAPPGGDRHAPVGRPVSWSASATGVVIAGIFGARADMDAFLAASTLPQDVVAVLLGALAVVFVPVFLEYDGVRRLQREAWRVASSVVTADRDPAGRAGDRRTAARRAVISGDDTGIQPESLALAARVARISGPASRPPASSSCS